MSDTCRIVDNAHWWPADAHTGERCACGRQIRCVHRSWVCDHCHDDPPPGHTCPRCGTEPGPGPAVRL